MRYVALEPLRIRADSRRLEQVLVNLLTNAIKFTGEAGVVSVHLSRQDGHAVIRVADTGRGIPSDLLPRIFDRFWQAGQVEAQQGGLGLGLNIVRSLVELHGGSIRADSAGDNQGAEFTVRLPCIDGRSSAETLEVSRE